MRRRDFIGALLLASQLRDASAQQAATKKRMAIASPAGRIEDMRIGRDSSFTVGLRELERLGFVEGQNLTIDRYSAEGNKDQYLGLARLVVSTHPDLISTSGSPLTRAFLAATRTIPIVTITGDPVRQRLVESIARPGGNLTGVSVDAGFELWGKRLQVFVEALPDLRRIFFISTAATWEGGGAKEAREVAQKLGISLLSTLVSSPVDEAALRRTFEAINPVQGGGILIAYETELFFYRKLVVELVGQVRLPAMYCLREQAEAGGLMAYADDFSQAIRLLAQQQADILRGKLPSELPYLQATNFELVINLNTARQLGLELSPTFVARADKVIE